MVTASRSLPVRGQLAQVERRSSHSMPPRGDRGLGHEQAASVGFSTREVAIRDACAPRPPRSAAAPRRPHQREQAVDRVQPVGVLVRLARSERTIRDRPSTRRRASSSRLAVRMAMAAWSASSEARSIAAGPLARRGAVGVEHADHVVVLPQRHAQHRAVVLAHGQPAPGRADLAWNTSSMHSGWPTPPRPRRPDAHLQRRRVLEVLGVLLPTRRAGQREPVRGHPWRRMIAAACADTNDAAVSAMRSSVSSSASPCATAVLTAMIASSWRAAGARPPRGMWRPRSRCCGQTATPPATGASLPITSSTVTTHPKQRATFSSAELCRSSPYMLLTQSLTTTAA